MNRVVLLANDTEKVEIPMQKLIIDLKTGPYNLNKN